MTCAKTATSSVDCNHGKVAFANPFGGAKQTYSSSTTTKCPHCVESRNAEIAAAIRAKSIKASKLAHFALTVTMSVAAYMVTLKIIAKPQKEKKHCQTCRCCKS
ncbi:hypothetical protein DAI22_02g127300 [Oryza sativa Japonica Group]|uniref:Uncharacterized protein n=1 Tax=Oryza barthii TaxID=65489 RepID=A0A0D3F3R4_9ORYZ|nr:hypothetical protein DAI22_02g127300 [Oryza sativa Japonica Group]KAF2944239.1 hypothetical protein DAI22_02g127300 [Oryza sativa Japonica Group]